MVRERRPLFLHSIKLFRIRPEGEICAFFKDFCHLKAQSNQFFKGVDIMKKRLMPTLYLIVYSVLFALLRQTKTVVTMGSKDCRAHYRENYCNVD